MHQKDAAVGLTLGLGERCLYGPAIGKLGLNLL
jgi:hypothetical protein